VTPKKLKSKNIRQHEVEEEYRPRLHRTVGAYLALKAWIHDFDCIVLSRNDLEKFFDIKSTPVHRMEQIKRDIKPWFQGFKSYHRENDRTYVNYLVLLRREEDIAHFSSSIELSDRSARLLIKKVNSSNESKAPKTALFSEVVNEGKVPTQKEILSELVLVVAGLELPEVKGGLANQQQRLSDSAQLKSPQPKVKTEVQKPTAPQHVIF